MRRLSLTILAVLTVAALAACSGGATPGWTYPPEPSASAGASGAAPSGGGSGAASAAPSAASAAPSAAASAGGSAAASGGATALTVTAPSGAATTGFDPKTLTATANTAFTLHFDNQDNQPHNVQLKKADGSAVQLGGDTNFFTGPGTRDYQVPALGAGDYTFFCVVHPTTMTGTLSVK
jgi:plastocyanin